MDEKQEIAALRKDLNQLAGALANFADWIEVHLARPDPKGESLTEAVASALRLRAVAKEISERFKPESLPPVQ